MSSLNSIQNENSTQEHSIPSKNSLLTVVELCASISSKLNSNAYTGNKGAFSSSVDSEDNDYFIVRSNGYKEETNDGWLVVSD